ncbi:MAG: hypothetical protein IJN43_02110 [Ruminococcus sp.]|nr:hypothetical protein [Ruminococcus sp.]
MKRANKTVIISIILIIVTIILTVLFPDSGTPVFILLLVFLIFPFVTRIVNGNKNQKLVYERLGVSTKEEYYRALSEFNELIANRLYIKDDLIININSYDMYYINEIVSIEKVNRRHYSRYGHTYRNISYELKIITDSIIDTLKYDTNVSGRDCAYLLLSRKLTEFRQDTAGDVYDGFVSNEKAYSMDEYDDMIMDEEDIKDRENRSDWLG